MPPLGNSLLPAPIVQNRTPAARRYNGIKSALTVRWAHIKSRLCTVDSPFSTSIPSAASVDDKDDDNSIPSFPPHPQGTDEEPKETKVDEVVVDRVWSDDPKSSVTQYHSDHSEKSETGSTCGSVQLNLDQFRLPGLQMHSERLNGFWSPLLTVPCRAWPSVRKFFSLRFHDERAEANYRDENWLLNKARSPFPNVPQFLQPVFLLVIGHLGFWVRYRQLGPWLCFHPASCDAHGQDFLFWRMQTFYLLGANFTHPMSVDRTSTHHPSGVHDNV